MLLGVKFNHPAKGEWYKGDKWQDYDVSVYQSASLMETSNAYIIMLLINTDTITMPSMETALPEYGYSVRPVFKK